jgi:tetratricopeptide (TPR) repeat protein
VCVPAYDTIFCWKVLDPKCNDDKLRIPTLHITESLIGSDSYRIELSLESDGQRPQVATAEFGFSLTAQDREDVRWYLEDYLQNAGDPAPRIAARIEKRIADVGTELFNGVFQCNTDARNLWAALRMRLNDARLEVTTGGGDATALPWELLRDPQTDAPLALHAAAFVRASHHRAQRPELVRSATGRIRILLVICRPRGAKDVPFRSVASRLIKGLGERERAVFQLDVLRPPTFEQLIDALRRAKAVGKPYDVVHFDGHGTYEDVTAKDLGRPPENFRGYIAFENAASGGNEELVHGTMLGSLLAEADVPVLVLNACRSAHAEALPAPEKAESDATAVSAATNLDIHVQVRAFSSLAQETVDAGVLGVVAMRYNVYVVTAAQFVADLYAAFVQGETLGEAVTLSRKRLSDHPLREIAYMPRPLQDWMVPIVYEAAPVALFPKPAERTDLTLTISAGDAIRGAGALAGEVERPPEAGFFGRDETLLALDRAFDTHSIVLLHAYAGSGKTSAAAEFGRWYQSTGGIDGPVLFTSFEHRKTLPQALNDAIGRAFADVLERSSIHWPALTDEMRREVALDVVLRQFSVLWIWDNVEPIAGFPTGTSSAWSAGEQEQLADFLRAATSTRAKFLLTSRRDERAWLGNLPARVHVPPMPMQERLQLSRAQAEKHGRQFTNPQDWLPLLHFTQGNPLAATVLVGQALRDGLETSLQIEAFVSQLRAGEDVFEDEESEGRSKSLGASLSYGLQNGFSEIERIQLALLHFFQGSMNAQVLSAMGEENSDWFLAQAANLNDKAAVELLDRAAEIGLVTPLGSLYYTVHPAVPWFLNRLFVAEYPGPDERLRATRAFVCAMGAVTTVYTGAYSSDDANRSISIATLFFDEQNVLHALKLGQRHGYLEACIQLLHGLDVLYNASHRNEEWERLMTWAVANIPTADHSLSELNAVALTQFQIDLARRNQRLEQARDLQGDSVKRLRTYISDIEIGRVKVPQKTRDLAIQNLAASLTKLGLIQRDLGDVACAATLEESFEFALKIGDDFGASTVADTLGRLYLRFPGLRNLSKAEYWTSRSLAVQSKEDKQGKAVALGELGAISLARFGQENDRRYLDQAMQYYKQALSLLPAEPSAVHHRATTLNMIGVVWAEYGEIDSALVSFKEAIVLMDASSDHQGAGKTRLNVALALAKTGRLEHAKEYAESALRLFEACGPSAEESRGQAQVLLTWIADHSHPRGILLKTRKKRFAWLFNFLTRQR